MRLPRLSRSTGRTSLPFVLCCAVACATSTEPGSEGSDDIPRGGHANSSGAGGSFAGRANTAGSPSGAANVSGSGPVGGVSGAAGKSSTGGAGQSAGGQAAGASDGGTMSAGGVAGSAAGAAGTFAQAGSAGMQGGRGGGVAGGTGSAGKAAAGAGGALGGSAGAGPGGGSGSGGACNSSTASAKIEHSKTASIKSDDCVELVTNPTWTSVNTTIEGAPGTTGYPIPFSFTYCSGSGKGSLTADFVKETLLKGDSPKCSIFVQFEGSGTALNVTHYD